MHNPLYIRYGWCPGGRADSRGVRYAWDYLPVIHQRLLTAAPWALYRCTHIGLATSAMAENQRAASAIGLSPDWIADANWALGSAVAGVATIGIGGVYAAVLAGVVLLTF